MKSFTWQKRRRNNRKHFHACSHTCETFCFFFTNASIKQTLLKITDSFNAKTTVPSKKRIGDLTELQAHKAAPRLQHSVGLINHLKSHTHTQNHHCHCHISCQRAAVTAVLVQHLNQSNLPHFRLQHSVGLINHLKSHTHTQNLHCQNVTATSRVRGLQ